MEMDKKRFVIQGFTRAGAGKSEGPCVCLFITKEAKSNTVHLTTILQWTVILSAAPPQPVLVESERRGVEEPRECLDLEYRSKAFYPDLVRSFSTLNPL